MNKSTIKSLFSYQFPYLDISINHLYFLLLACLIYSIGLGWDVSFHGTVGRDTFWTAPHAVAYGGVSIPGIWSFWLIWFLSKRGTAQQKANCVRIGPFYAPIGAWLCFWGALTVLAAAYFDDWWHAVYGLDASTLTPAHYFISISISIEQIGIMYLANYIRNNTTSKELKKIASVCMSLALGFVLFRLLILQFDLMAIIYRHTSFFYQVAAISLPLFFSLIAVTSDARWGVTLCTVPYTVLWQLLTWILPLIPAKTLLEPVYHPLDHYIWLGPPMLIIVPAFVIDLIRPKIKDWPVYILAPTLSALFVIVFFLIQWPASTFLLSSFYNQYPLFGQMEWPYFVPDNPYLHQFYLKDTDALGQFSWIKFLIGIFIAILIGTVSSSIGILWGRVLQKVKR